MADRRAEELGIATTTEFAAQAGGAQERAH